MKLEWLKYTLLSIVVFLLFWAMVDLFNNISFARYRLFVPLLSGIIMGTLLWRAKEKIDAWNKTYMNELMRVNTTLQNEITRYEYTATALSHSERYLQSLLGLSKQLQQANTYDEIISIMQPEIQAILGYQSVWLYLIDENQEVATLLTYRGSKIPPILGPAFSINVTGDPFLEESLSASHIVVAEDARTDSRTNKQVVADLDNRTIIHVPLLLMDKQLGLFGTGTFGDEGVKAPAPDQLNYLQTATNHIAVAVERVQFSEKQRLYEQTLQESEERYRILVESAPLSILVYKQDKIIYANPSATDVFKARHPDDFWGKPFMQFVHPDSRALVQNRQQQLAAGESLEPVEERVIRLDGQVRDVEVYTNPIVYQSEPAVLAIVRDVTEHKQLMMEREQLIQTQQRLLQAQQRLTEVARIISSTLDLPTILSNVVRLAAELIAAEAGAMALIAPDGVTISYPYLFNLPQDVSRPQQPKRNGLVWQIVETGQPILVADCGQYADAESYWIKAGVRSFIGVPILAGKTPLGVLALFNRALSQQFSQQDMILIESVGRQAGVAIENARMYAEEHTRSEALVAALAQQEDLKRLKSDFIRNLVHELRTPLTIAMGYADLLADDEFGEFSSEQQETIGIIIRRMQALKHLINDATGILAANEQGLRTEMVALTKVAQKSLCDFEAMARKSKLTLTADLAADVSPVWGNPIYLRQLIENLLDNAIKFTPVGGVVTVRLYEEGQQVILEVIDTGIGMPTNQLERIFDRFYQIDSSVTRRYEGAGLGLALVKEIVAACGGQVVVQSQEGYGSTFRVILPASLNRA